MSEETKAAPKTATKKAAAKKPAAPKGRLFAFARPNCSVGIPMPGGGVQHKNVNGTLPIVELLDPLEIEAVAYAATHFPGKYAGQYHDNPEIKEVSKGLTEEQKSLITGDGHEFNRKTYDMVFQKAERV